MESNIHITDFENRIYIPLNEVASLADVSRPKLIEGIQEYESLHPIANLYGNLMCKFEDDDRYRRRTVVMAEEVSNILKTPSLHLEKGDIDSIMQTIVQAVKEYSVEHDIQGVNLIEKKGDNEAEDKMDVDESTCQINQELLRKFLDTQQKNEAIYSKLIEAKESLATVVAEKAGYLKANQLLTETVKKQEVMLQAKDQEADKYQTWVDRLTSNREDIEKVLRWTESFRFPPYPGIHVLVKKSYRFYCKKVRTLWNELRNKAKQDGKDDA